MEAAAQTDDPVDNVGLSVDQRQASTQLYYILVMLCKEGPLTRIINAGPGEGLVAWRALARHYEPQSSARQAALLLDLLSFSFEGDLEARVAQFERDIARYEKSVKPGQPNRVLADDVKIGILMRQLPESTIKQHLLLNIDRFDTYVKVQEEITAVIRAQKSAASSSTPMDLGAFQAKGSLGKGMGRGGKGGQNPTQDIVCSMCGKRGHLKRDCWHNNDKGNKGKGKSKDKNGKGGGGKGKGQRGSQDRSGGKDMSKIKCWKCGQKGHLAKDYKKPIGSVQEGGQQGQASTGSVEGLYLAAVCSPCAPIAAVASSSTMVKLGIDSGAAVTVVPPHVAGKTPLTQDQKSGSVYESATGQKIVNKGQVTLLCRHQGSLRGLRARCVAVKKPLVAVVDMLDAGHKVVFDRDDNGKDQSCAIHKSTGEITPFEHRNRVWELSVQTIPHGEYDKTIGAMRDLCPVFKRQAPKP
eukprot:1467091-Amphidinium_carterae.2